MPPQIFRFSILEGRPLPGMALMNLRHRNEAAVAAAGRRRQGGADAAAAAVAGAAAGTGAAAAATAAAPGSSDFAGGGRSGVEGPGLSGAQRWLYCGGAVLLRYAWARLGVHAAAAHWGDASRGGWRLLSWAALRRVESGYRLASLLNFLAFLRWGRYRWAGRCGCLDACVCALCELKRSKLGLAEGGFWAWLHCAAAFCPAAAQHPLTKVRPLHRPLHRHRSLLERALRARLVYAQPSAARAISFEYLNRQLVWSELR